MIKIDIIEAKENMCKELAQVKRKVWETTYRGIYPNEKLDNYDFEKQAENFKSYIKSNATKLYVAINQNKIIGYTAIGNSPHRPQSKVKEIVMLYVLKEFQGLGIGKQLFNFAKEKIKETGDNKFLIYCNKNNFPAQSFYKKMGGVAFEDKTSMLENPTQTAFLYNI